MKDRRTKIVSIAPLVVCLAMQTVQAQEPGENLERHQNFRGEMLTTLVDQENWYRDIRAEMWGNSGMESARLLEILAQVAEQSDDTEIIDHDHESWIQIWMSVAKEAEEKAVKVRDAPDRRR